eukprot:TRINITY_DN2565_c0_g1_i2.p1 TRINITY_DN2565_c0_g1~~TRINITY_DN2565_c0_g1_i2.p1  ORF type:complete len:862 (+),score=133.20 TRINITY_DN2565_c0_g1_i2:80-2665(+)
MGRVLAAPSPSGQPELDCSSFRSSPVPPSALGPRASPAPSPVPSPAGGTWASSPPPRARSPGRRVDVAAVERAAARYAPGAVGPEERRDEGAGEVKLYRSRFDGREFSWECLDHGTWYPLLGSKDFRAVLAAMHRRGYSDGREWTVHNDVRRGERKEIHILVHTRPPQNHATSLSEIRVTAELPDTPPAGLFRLLHEHAYRATWDQVMERGYNICRLTRNNDIGYYQMRFGFGMSNRDFCNQRGWAELGPDEFIIANRSVSHPACPELASVTRGRSVLSAYYIAQSDSGRGTTLTFVTCTDPKGSLPSMVVNWFMKRAAPEGLVRLVACEKQLRGWLEETWHKSAGGTRPVPGPWDKTGEHEGWYIPVHPDTRPDWWSGLLDLEPSGPAGVLDEAEGAKRARIEVRERERRAALIRARAAGPDAVPLSPLVSSERDLASPSTAPLSEPMMLPPALERRASDLPVQGFRPYSQPPAAAVRRVSGSAQTDNAAPLQPCVTGWALRTTPGARRVSGCAQTEAQPRRASGSMQTEPPRRRSGSAQTDAPASSAPSQSAARIEHATRDAGCQWQPACSEGAPTATEWPAEGRGGLGRPRAASLRCSAAQRPRCGGAGTPAVQQGSAQRSPQSAGWAAGEGPPGVWEPSSEPLRIASRRARGAALDSWHPPPAGGVGAEAPSRAGTSRVIAGVAAAASAVASEGAAKARQRRGSDDRHASVPHRFDPAFGTGSISRSSAEDRHPYTVGCRELGLAPCAAVQRSRTEWGRARPGSLAHETSPTCADLSARAHWEQKAARRPLPWAAVRGTERRTGYAERYDTCWPVRQVEEEANWASSPPPGTALRSRISTAFPSTRRPDGARWREYV